MTSTTDVKSHLIPECLARPGDDPIFSLNAEAAQRAARGESILNATLGALMQDDGQLAIVPAVFDALAQVTPAEGASYAPIAGDPAFLRAVITDLFGDGPRAAQSVAVATPGGTGAVHNAIVNFLEPGDALLTTSYYWGPYRTLSTHTRRRVVTFPMFDEAGAFDAASFRQAAVDLAREQGRVLVVLNTPCHNPTGYTLDDRDWEGVVEGLVEAGRHGSIALCIDFAYARFGAGDPMAWLRHVDALGDEALLLVAWTASKAFTQYGARVGALVASTPDDEERTRISNALSYSCRGTWSNCNHLGMVAVTRLLTDPDLRARSNVERDELRQLLDTRVAAFNERAQAARLSYPRYEGGFFVTVFTPDAPATAARMRELGVYVVPLDGAVRVALCATPIADVPRLVDALAEGLAAAS